MRARADAPDSALPDRALPDAPSPLVAARLRICVTHMSPLSALARRAEADAIVRLARAEPDVPFLLLGDLNTLSPLDGAQHADDGLAARLALDESLAHKFLNLGAHGGVAYDPMGALLDGGFTDLGHLSSPGEFSVPTHANVDAMHAARMRLDYALASDAARRLCDCARAGLVRTVETSALSDHFPLLVQLGGCELRAPPTDEDARARTLASAHALGRTMASVVADAEREGEGEDGARADVDTGAEQQRAYAREALAGEANAARPALVTAAEPRDAAGATEERADGAPSDGADGTLAVEDEAVGTAAVGARPSARGGSADGAERSADVDLLLGDDGEGPSDARDFAPAQRLS